MPSLREIELYRLLPGSGWYAHRWFLNFYSARIYEELFFWYLVESRRCWYQNSKFSREISNCVERVDTFSVIWRSRTCTVIKLMPVYLNGNNAAEGENSIKYASSYPMNWTVKNWFVQDFKGHGHDTNEGWLRWGQCSFWAAWKGVCSRLGLFKTKNKHSPWPTLQSLQR